MSSCKEQIQDCRENCEKNKEYIDNVKQDLEKLKFGEDIFVESSRNNRTY